ncbi:MAG TPA: hypothetical protein VNB52_01270 [Ilumatobacteraceae bacterium]|nr:hypothetical protein [Ilumatobacteraceae bacterium]
MAAVVVGVVVAVVACVAAVVLLDDVVVVEVAVVAGAAVAAVEVASTDAEGDAALTDMYPTINIMPEAPAAPASRRARLAGWGRRRRTRDW